MQIIYDEKLYSFMFFLVIFSSSLYNLSAKILLKNFCDWSLIDENCKVFAMNDLHYAVYSSGGKLCCIAISLAFRKTFDL